MGAYTILTHAVVVAVVILVANGHRRAFGPDDLLHAFHFWVYNWIMPLFNREEMGPPIWAVYDFLGVSLQTFGQLYEWCFLVVFGGPVYALGVVTVSSWMRRRRDRHAVV